MCGIVGILNRRTQSAISVERLKEMRDQMFHRGPDDCGLYVDQTGSVGLGHRRLSIIDTSSAGHQPMSDDREKIWITFNGEIFNFLELREELERDNVSFKSRTDTEVLIYLYRKHGKDMLPKLRGMFAFAIFDSERRSLFLARDRVGIKPLYYFDKAGTFAFASEIKALLTSGLIERKVNVTALYHYFSFLTTPAPDTLFEGIQKLPAAHYLEVDENGPKAPQRWWSPLSAAPVEASEETHVQTIGHLLNESVRYGMVSDVPFGVFLSGGIDSSTNVALMARLMDRPVETFSIGFKHDEAFNEFEFARTVSRKFGTNHHEIRIGMRDLLDFLPQLIFHQDEPIADPVCIPVYYVAKLAKDSGVTVCQVGEGADELFCGYPHWSYVLGLERIRRAYSFVPPSLRKLITFFARQLEDPSSGRLEYIRRASYDEPIFWGGAEAFYEGHKRSLLHKDMRKSLAGVSSSDVIGRYFKEFLNQTERPSPLNWMSFIDLNLRLPELLLMRVDKMTMATSVEARVPFLDHKLVEYVMSIPQDAKVPGLAVKYLLKRVVRGLIPDQIIDRQKQGFGVPIVDWFQRELGQTVRRKLMDFARSHSYFDPEQVSKLCSQTANPLQWYLFNFVLWHETWIEQKPRFESVD